MIDTKIKTEDGGKLPFGTYEYVDVTFQRQNTDTLIPYTRLKADNPEDIRYIDVRREGVVTDGVDEYDLLPEFPIIYRLQKFSRKPWGRNYIFLRSSYAPYTTRLLLFVERNEASNV